MLNTHRLKKEIALRVRQVENSVCLSLSFQKSVLIGNELFSCVLLALASHLNFEEPHASPDRFLVGPTAFLGPLKDSCIKKCSCIEYCVELATNGGCRQLHSSPRLLQFSLVDVVGVRAGCDDRSAC